jgi:hypothetical protein
LTIKFTRHTAASLPAFSYQLSAISKPYTLSSRANIISRSETMLSRGTSVWFMIFSKTTTHRFNSMGLSACSSHGITASHLKSLAPDKSGTRNLKCETPPHTSRLLSRHS